MTALWTVFSLVTVTLLGSAQDAVAEFDWSFGNDGVASVEVIDDASIDDEPAPVVTQADGKILVATKDDENFAIFRFDTDGTLDLGFGDGGKVAVSLGGDDQPVDLAIQADGKIVVLGGSSLGATNRLGLVRLDANGSLDPSFGTGGVVTEQVTGANFPQAIAVQPNGKIVVTGEGAPFLQSDAFLVRFQDSGTLDDSFGQNGAVFISAGLWGDALYAVTLQPDGKIVATGLAFWGGDYGSWLIVRLLADGTPDQTFGVEGEVQLGLGAPGPLSPISQAFSVLVQADGKIVVAGSTGAVYLQWPSDFASARFDSSGQLDETYGSAGVSEIAPLGASSITYPTALLPGTDGRLTMVGPGATDASSSRSALVLRTSSDGNLDPNWSDDGIVEIEEVGLWTGDGLTVDAASDSSGSVIVSTRSGGTIELRRVTGVTDCGNGVMDPGESCDDSNLINGDCCSNLCQLESATQLCRPSTRTCDAPEFCDGLSPTCPSDQNAADGTACSDRNVCTQGDSCLAGVCEPGGCDEGKSCGLCGNTGQCAPSAEGACRCQQ